LDEEKDLQPLEEKKKKDYKYALNNPIKGLMIFYSPTSNSQHLLHTKKNTFVLRTECIFITTLHKSHCLIIIRCQKVHKRDYIHVKGPTAAMRFIHVRIVGPTFLILMLSMSFFSF
jgi:hypothetical protein